MHVANEAPPGRDWLWEVAGRHAACFWSHLWFMFIAVHDFFCQYCCTLFVISVLVLLLPTTEAKSAAVPRYMSRFSSRQIASVAARRLGVLEAWNGSAKTEPKGRVHLFWCTWSDVNPAYPRHLQQLPARTLDPTFANTSSNIPETCQRSQVL